MDDETWDFFCNNSPQLVEIPRTRTPHSKKSIKLTQENPKKLKSPKKQLKCPIRSSLIKNPITKISEFRNISKDLYRDITPPASTKKTHNNWTSKPVNPLQEIEANFEETKDSTPGKSSKKKVFISKRLTFVSQVKTRKL